MAGDNADPAQAGRMVDAAFDTWGRLDGALVSVGGPPANSVMDTTDEEWTAAFGSVFLGAVRIARTVAERLAEGGSIGFVLSSSVRAPIAGLAISNGLRPGLAMVAKTLADELGPRGIRVNGLMPGRIETERLRELDARGGDPEESRARSHAGIPLRTGRTARGVRPGGGVPAQPGGVIRVGRDAAGRRGHGPRPLTGCAAAATRRTRGRRSRRSRAARRTTTGGRRRSAVRR